MYNPPLIWLLPAGYQMVTKWLPSFIGIMYGSYQVTRLPVKTEEVIILCTIHP